MKHVLSKLKNALGRIGIVWRISILFSVLMLIPTVIIAVTYYRSFEQSLIEEADKQLTEDVLVMSATMEKNLEAANAMLNQLSFNQELAYFLDANNYLSERELRYFMSGVQDELLSIRYTYPNKFNQIAFYSGNVQIEENYDWAYHMTSLYDRSYYDEVSEGEDIFYGNVRAQELIYLRLAEFDNLVERNTLVLPVYQKIYNLSSRTTVGVIEINILLTKLIEDPSITEERGIFLLYDRKDALVLQIGGPEDAGFDEVAFPENSGTLDVVVDGGRYRLAYDRCPQTGIVRAAAMDQREVLGSIEGMEKTLTAVSVLSVMGIMLFAYLSMRIMLRRLRDMSASMERIQQGQFDVRIDEHGFQEISVIAASFNRMASQLQSVMKQQIEQEKAQRKAELQALQAQINPHFLYNTLENMRMQCEIDEYYTVGDSLAALGDLLRYSIKWESATVPLEQEWHNLENYISIMRMRFDTDVVCTMNCDLALGDVMVPKFILQPLAENSFNHAFNATHPPWEVSIDVWREEGRLLARVADNGAGIPPERLEEVRTCLAEGISIPNPKKKRSSIGLVNVAQRVRMLCNPGSEVRVDSEVGKGTTVTISIVLYAQEEAGDV